MEKGVIISVALIILSFTSNVMSNELSNDLMAHNDAVEIRFQKMEERLHQQDVQILNQNFIIEGLKNVISTQQSLMYESEKRFKDQSKFVYLLKRTVSTHMREISELKDRLSVVVSNQNRITENLDFILKENSSLVEKCDSKERSKNAESTEHVIKQTERDRRLLLRSIQRAPCITTRATAFFAFFSHYEFSLVGRHILVFDSIRTNINNAYSESTGVFTTPASGVYGFIYTLRMGCNGSPNDNSSAPFEMVRNTFVESVVMIYQHGCTDQTTVTGNAIIHSNQGDKIYVRTHSTFPIDGTLISDANGISSFSGWLISADAFS